MELKRPRPTGTTSEMANDLQHEAAMRIQARLDADRAFQRRVARWKAVKSALSMLLMVGTLLGVVWAWRTGLLDPPHEDAAPQPQDTPAPEVQTPPSATPAARAAADPKRYAADLAKFADASVDYWKNARPEDRPGKSRVLSFTGFVPEARGGFSLLEIEMGGGRFAAKRVDAAGTEAPLDRAAFNQLIARTPYLVAREGRAYFCSAGRGDLTRNLKVPDAGGALDPSRAEFGPLADCLAAAKVKTPPFRYEVSLVIEKFRKTVPVATVGFGESVPRSAFEQAAGKLIADSETVAILLSLAKVQVKPAK